MAVGDQYGLLAFKPNEQIQAEEREAAMLEDSDRKEAVIDDLAAHCRREWQRARDAKQPIEREMLDSMRQREGVYPDQKLAAIRQVGGSEIKMMLTDVKCRAAESWLRDIIFGSGERPFSCEPTPIPEMPQQLTEAIARESYKELEAIAGAIPNPRDVRERIEAYHDLVMKHARRAAKVQAERMEDKIDDEFVQGNFYQCFEDFLWDFVTLKAGIIKGPVIRRKKQLAWAIDNAMSNSLKPMVENKLQRMYYAPSPFDIYLTPEARHFQEGTLIERHRMAPDVLSNFMDVPGYSEKAIRTALEEYGDHGLSDWLWYDFERSRLEGRPYDQIYDSGNLIDTLEMWTKVRGRWLQDWGFEGNVDPDRYYESNVWLIGNNVIKATLNEDPLGIRPYHNDSYVRVRNSPWGRGVPELMTDLQDMCDASARALSNNMGIASGPQAEIFVDRLPDGEEITKQYPWKVWQTLSNKFGTPGPAVNYFQPDNNAQPLMSVFQFFSNLADEYTGIPKYQQGDAGGLGGAGRTASGMSMLMNASSRLMKGVIANIDRVVKACVQMTHRHVLQHDKDMPYKGDVKVVAKASQALLHRESQQMRINETLAATMNPVDFSIIGPKGRLELLRGALRGIDAIDVEKVLPSNDHMLMEALAQNQQLGPPGQQPPPEKQGAGERPQESIEGMAG